MVRYPQRTLHKKWRLLEYNITGEKESNPHVANKREKMQLIFLGALACCPCLEMSSSVLGLGLRLGNTLEIEMKIGYLGTIWVFAWLDISPT